MTTLLPRPATGPSVFGAVHLGYVVVETERFTEWHRFGADAIGLHVDELDRDTMRFRMDDRECRFLLRRGPAEDLVGAGWQVDDHETFDEILSRVADRSVPVTEGTAEECALRGVERLWRFPGPKGISTEIFTRARTTAAPLKMLNSAFVTGAAGMGHLAITTKRPDELRSYYNTVFDARITDFIDENISGLTLKIRFLRVNERHHSIAVANVNGVRIDPIRTSIQHMNIQIETLDDLLASFERVTDLGFAMAWSVGQHTNDRELSYYSVTPSGFELEVGWNPVVITPELESTWDPSTYQGISIWGHKPVGETVVTKMAQFQGALRSLREREVVVSELSEVRR
ncbi:2,3-dihydroxybiphenyl 1,2-dioxygenase [Promicromonospora sp. AC04]|uniref:VOC family protein n=1 Tax=Promicromonospora sp. AC04 TaxID=2135723 RepID=UPI000D3D783E|nr:VOC family protein [Promicromonospora sp. AC04]PUB27603.1 2,3-dihydroxybiphenyl 1,2-dioxygenase [Promicromonospora sp. AC04]